MTQECTASLITPPPPHTHNISLDLNFLQVGFQDSWGRGHPPSLPSLGYTPVHLALASQTYFSNWSKMQISSVRTTNFHLSQWRLNRETDCPLKQKKAIATRCCLLVSSGQTRKHCCGNLFVSCQCFPVCPPPRFIYIFYFASMFL